MRTSPLHTYCPYCFSKTSAAIDPVSRETPLNGDIGLCRFCGELSIFCDRGRRLRKPSYKEKLSIVGNRDAQAMKQAWSP